MVEKILPLFDAACDRVVRLRNWSELPIRFQFDSSRLSHLVAEKANSGLLRMICYAMNCTIIPSIYTARFVACLCRFAFSCIVTYAVLYINDAASFLILLVWSWRGLSHDR